MSLMNLDTFTLAFQSGLWFHVTNKVEGHIPAQVQMPPLGSEAFYMFYKSIYQGAFTLHSAANIL